MDGESTLRALIAPTDGHRLHSNPLVSPSKSWILPGLLVGAMAFVAAALVVGSIRRPEPPAWAPTPADPVEAGDALVGPRVYTVDATDPDRWRFFDFSRGSLVDRPGERDWDLAFRRNEIVVNGGDLPGEGGVRSLGSHDLDSVRTLPSEGYAGSVAGRDTTSPGIGKWYDYGFTSHLLTPKPRVYAVRTADGRYAKLEILGYYCPGARAGCVTFRYVYQGDGSRSVWEPDRPTAFHSAIRSEPIRSSRPMRSWSARRSTSTESSRAHASSRSPTTRR